MPIIKRWVVLSHQQAVKRPLSYNCNADAVMKPENEWSRGGTGWEPHSVRAFETKKKKVYFITIRTMTQKIV